MTQHPIEGGIYTTKSKDHFSIIKVLKFEDDIVHVRQYKNRFTDIPVGLDAATLELGTIHDPGGFGIGHTPYSLNAFWSMKPQFLQHSLVLPEELEGYEYWKDAGGGVWE
jgi:hypothetical protein